MWTEEVKRGWEALDEAADRAGGYLAKSHLPLVVDYDYHAISNYCHEKGIKNTELTDEELKMFQYDEPLIYF